MKKLFFSYSHKDESLRDQLETHLSMLKRKELITSWHDRRIAAGDELDREISIHLEGADVILLLVSADFLASSYCYETEMKRALERHSAKEATVIPVILRPCDWHDALFGQLMATPKDGRPITTWPNIDEAFLDVTTAIKAALKKRGAVPTASLSLPTTPIGNGRSEPEIRSSNLRIAKHFTDREKDEFLHDTFEFVAKFFDNSLAELSRRNPAIERTFRRIDADCFTATIYRDGKTATQCSIFLGGLHGGLGSSASGISYSIGETSTRGGFNEHISVEADDQKLFMRSLGMGAFGRTSEHEKLSMQGGAELLWEMFIQPLQRL